MDQTVLVYMVSAVVAFSVVVLVYALFRVQISAREVAQVVAELMGYKEGSERYTRLAALEDRVVGLMGPMISALASDPEFEERIIIEIVQILAPYFEDEFSPKEIAAVVIRVAEAMLANGLFGEDVASGEPVDEVPPDDDVHVMARQVEHLAEQPEMVRFYNAFRKVAGF